MSLSKEDLNYWKDEFIEFMCNKYHTDKETALFECEAYLESVGTNDINDFDTAVNECADGWN